MRTFHAVIIACLLLVLGGCGYKTDPVYGFLQIENEKNSTII